MTNVLLTKKYKGREAGSILTDLAEAEATALEIIGVGQKLKEEPPAPKEKAKKDAAE
ncbi:hypothetical protein HJA85_27055 [Rhizobium bangladeshense]|uniref:hypothetical protein n=1 Tax=Rhizobium bangladeshense TaxID=1138189 RepID=UPI001C836CF9|nr:hypothetical protein [Rhizobium bangladeshense]MBX4870584.1 hypothetical protein [Rhizobium bangladeshense]